MAGRDKRDPACFAVSLRLRCNPVAWFRSAGTFVSYHRPQVIRQGRNHRTDPRAYGEWVYSDADEGWISQADFDAIAVEPVGSSKPVESEKIPMMAPFVVTASRIADFGAQFRGSLGWGVARAALGGAGGYAKGLLWSGPKEMITGIYHTVVHPIDTITGVANLAEALANDPVDVAKKIADEIATAATDSEGIGKIVFGIGTMVIPAGAAARVEKIGSAAENTGTALANRTIGELTSTLKGAPRNALNQLFGNGANGATRALESLRAGGSLPQGLTRETLETYREIAVRQIARGADANGAQAVRLQVIEEALKKL